MRPCACSDVCALGALGVQIVASFGGRVPLRSEESKSTEHGSLGHEHEVPYLQSHRKPRARDPPNYRARTPAYRARKPTGESADSRPSVHGARASHAVFYHNLAGASTYQTLLPTSTLISRSHPTV